MQFYVKDIMSTDLITIRENVSIRDAIKVLASSDISGLPVIDRENKLVGVVTMSDILQTESQHTFYSMPFKKKDINLELIKDTKFFDQPVSAIMSKELCAVSPDETVAKMAKTMYEKRIHRLLVTEYGKLIGIITTFDALKLLATSDESVVIQ